MQWSGLLPGVQIVGCAPVHGNVARSFGQLVAVGQEALARVETFASAGRAHVPGSRAVVYPTPTPTFGPHHDAWLEPGLYREVHAPALLVHSLEHGNIVIYIDRAGIGVEEALLEWSRRFNG